MGKKKRKKLSKREKKLLKALVFDLMPTPDIRFDNRPGTYQRNKFVDITQETADKMPIHQTILFIRGKGVVSNENLSTADLKEWLQSLTIKQMEAFEREFIKLIDGQPRLYWPGILRDYSTSPKNI